MFLGSRPLAFLIVTMLLLSDCAPTGGRAVSVAAAPSSSSGVLAAPAAPITPTATSAPAPAAAVTTASAVASRALASAKAVLGLTGLPRFGHVFVIVMENKEDSRVVGSRDAPYINQLAAQFARAGNYYAIRHPSVPNYLALTGGDTFGIVSDCTNCYIHEDNLANQLETAGRSWKAYMESMNQPCSMAVSENGLYVRRHDPFLYYDDIRNDTARCGNVVPLTQLDADLQSNQVPDFVWISPNLCDDMHDCSVYAGNQWLKTWVPKILASDAWKQNGVLFITYDEGASSLGCCQLAAGGKIDTLVISPLVRPGYVSQVTYDHYSLLRTIEEAWGLPLLRNASCDCTADMRDFFAAH